MVETGVYRSSFPRTRNIAFMKRLGLKSVVSLVPEDYPSGMLDFYNSAGITLLSHGLGGMEVMLHCFSLNRAFKTLFIC